MGNGAERWVEERRKKQEKLEVSPQRGGGEMSQSLLNGTFGGVVRLHPMENSMPPWPSEGELNTPKDVGRAPRERTDQPD